MSLRRTVALTAVMAWAGTASAACFTVFDAADRVVYQSTTPPVDISLPISQALAAVYPRRHHLVMADDSYCPGIGESAALVAAPSSGARAVAGGSPALALADGFQGRHRREETMPHGAGLFTPIDARDAGVVSDAAAPPKPRRRGPVRRR